MRRRPLIEICVDSLESAKAAIHAGADRLEVCSALSLGGLTPDLSLIASLKPSPIPILGMLRSRAGDFLYSKDEQDEMLKDLQGLVESGVDGIVTGALVMNPTTNEIDPDLSFISRVIASCSPIPVTFHKAFDSTTGDLLETMRSLASAGVARVLSSGRAPTALEGLDNLVRMVQIKSPTVVVAGSVRAYNFREILHGTNCSEIHSRSLEILCSKSLE